MTARHAFNKALEAQKCLPELEHFIMQDGGWAYNYAKYIMQDRWYDAEEVIAKSDCQTDYIREFFNEPVITKDKVDIIQWERKNLQGYFAPIRLF